MGRDDREGWASREGDQTTPSFCLLFLASPPAPSQLAATCNVEQSFFNDWFSGHLNFQIEHQ